MAQKIDKTRDDAGKPGRWTPAQHAEAEDEVELASEDSFPASDPPSYTPVTHTGKPKPEEKPGKAKG